MIEHITERHNTGGLKELPATAICGNDITSSCLYVSALAITFAGKFAWLSLLIVAAVLYLFRKIYGEVVGALPLNGGAYNALLNTTSKRVASLAACLTLLSYMATAVISGLEAMHYVEHFVEHIPVLMATAGLLLGFALSRFTDASLPYMDSMLTAFSIAAQWMQTRKLLENWLLWLAVDVFYVSMFLYLGLYLTAGLYASFLFLAVLGYVQWRRSWRLSLPGPELSPAAKATS